MPKELTPFTKALQGKSHRNPLYRYFWTNYEQIQQAIQQTARVDWVGACAELQAQGIATSKKSKLNPDMIRRTWSRVVQDKAKIGQRTTPTPKPLVAPRAEPQTDLQIILQPIKPKSGSQ